jgi:hypothetical protein
MPFRLDDIERTGAPISFLAKGEISVRTGPCSAKSFNGKKIILDGRHYVCAGTVTLKNGMKLRANFEITTHTFDFLQRDTVKVYIERERAWYYITEQGLYDLLGTTKENALPYTWLPDRPLDYHNVGPYPMKWPDE